MLVYLIRRIGQSLLVVAVMASIVFVALYAVGNPVDILANPNADEKETAAIARPLGLDKPLFEQFGLFVWNALHGDLGRSFVYNVPALEVILQRLPATLELALVGLSSSVAVGLPLGLLAGLKPERPCRPRHHVRLDPRLLAAELLDRPDADPSLRRRMRLLPASGRGATVDVLRRAACASSPSTACRHLVLPALHPRALQGSARGAHRAGGYARRMLQDYIRFARAKGLSPARIVWCTS